MNIFLYLAFSLAAQTPSWILWSALVLILALGGSVVFLATRLLRNEKRLDKKDGAAPQDLL